MPTKILGRYYKIGPITDHRAKFHAGRRTHLGDFAKKEKIKNIMSKTEVLPKKLSFSGGLKTLMTLKIERKKNREEYENAWS